MTVLRKTLPVLLGATITLVAGCSKQEEAPSAPSAPKEITAPAEAPKPAEAQKAVEDTAAAANTQVSGLIDKAKSLVSDQKYPEALDVLKELSSMKLTPEQQKLVDDLKAQVQKAMAGGAASEATKSATDAVGGLLGK
jgi:outer membrane PBP1 activator LpoA protein